MLLRLFPKRALYLSDHEHEVNILERFIFKMYLLSHALFNDRESLCIVMIVWFR